jgi:hypothetical protein
MRGAKAKEEENSRIKSLEIRTGTENREKRLDATGQEEETKYTEASWPVLLSCFDQFDDTIFSGVRCW